jgi:hypothetical protein
MQPKIKPWRGIRVPELTVQSLLKGRLPMKISLRNLASLAGLRVGIIVLSLHGSSAWAANLLANGSFEAGTYSFGGDGAQDLPPGSATITGWTVEWHVDLT